MDEDWDVVRGFLPDGWQELGLETGALKGLRKNKSAESSLRVLLLHLGCGHSLRETSVRAREADLAERLIPLVPVTQDVVWLWDRSAPGAGLSGSGVRRQVLSGEAGGRYCPRDRWIGESRRCQARCPMMSR